MLNFWKAGYLGLKDPQDLTQNKTNLEQRVLWLILRPLSPIECMVFLAERQVSEAFELVVLP